MAQLHRRPNDEKRNFRRHLLGAVPGVALLAVAFTQAQAAERRPERTPAAQAAKAAKAPAAPVTRVAQAGSYIPPAAAELPAHRILAAQIRALGESFNGDIGIAVKDVETGWTAAYDGNTFFPQQSVSKFWVALTALDKSDRGEIDLHRAVTLHKSDLTLFNQPIARLIGSNGYTTTIASLIERAMQQSDNTANDFILWQVGGPDAVRDFLGRNGISGIRFGPGERLMQARIAGMEWQPSFVGSRFYTARNAVPSHVRRSAFESYVRDPVDGATPLGIVDTLARLQKGEILSPGSTDRLLRIMSNTRTGPQRLKGGLGAGWSLAHKTGTGQVLGATQSGYNDIGIVTSPNGKHYAVAVMIRRTAAPIPQRMEMMQSVTRAIINYDRNLGSVSFAGGGGTPVSTK